MMRNRLPVFVILATVMIDAMGIGLIIPVMPDLIQEVTGGEVIEFLADKVAKWWLPDAVEFVDDIPHTATGKISKKDLRDRFAEYRLEE